MKTLITFLFVLGTSLAYAGCGPYEIVNVSPSVGDNQVAVNTSISFTPNNMLNCSVVALIDSGYIRVFESVTDELVDSVNINVYYPQDYEASMNEQLTFNLNILLDSNTTYYVTMDVGSMKNPCCSNGGIFGMQGYEFGEWVTTPQPHWEGFIWEFTTVGNPPVTVPIREVEDYLTFLGNKVRVNTNGELLITDISGRIVFKELVTIGVEVTLITKGLYVIRFTDGVIRQTKKIHMY